MKPFKILLSLLVILLVSTACQGDATPTETLEPTQVPTDLPTPTNAPEPTLVPTEVPTAEPTEVPVIQLVTQDAILNISWQWTEWIQTQPAAQAVIPDPENYTLTFLPDNSFQIQADCNVGGGTYAVDGLNMKITLGAITLAECGPDSLSSTFLEILGQVSSFGMQDGKLLLLLAADAGQIGLVNTGTTEVPQTPSSGVCDAGIDPADVGLDTLTLADVYQSNCVAATQFDGLNPTGPKGLPDHIEVNFGVTNPQDRQYGDPVIYIIPVAEYQQLWEQNGDIRVTETYSQVVSLLQARPDPIPTEGMPVLPFEEVTGSNDLVTQYAYVDTDFGFGVRFVGRFSQSVSPVTNDAPQLFYIFQGLSDDGLYLISFFYPVRTDELPDSGAVSADELQESQTDPRAYLDGKIEELNALTYADWEPALSTLDAVITSLVFPPPFEGPGLTDALWSWNELILPDGTSLINNPDNYTLRFLPDGTLNITADCNSGSGTYTADRQSLTIQVGVMTTAFCGDKSLDTQFLGYLAQVVSFDLQPAYLALSMAEEAGTLGFYIGSPIVDNPDLPADAPTAEAIDTINVRSGPGVDYPSYGLAKKGDKALILGVSADGAWWVIELPTYVAPDGRGWVSAEYATATNADNVAVIEAPPLP
jgi:heat shock protein HslJ